VYEIGGVEDHVHLLLSLPRTLTISNLLEDIKKISSKWMKDNAKGLKYFGWQNGYGVFSVSESVKEKVIEYIQNQKEHHKKVTFQEEFLKFLKVNKVPYNEEFLWK
jgi:REP element-mobilizing transposase RayT